MKGRARAVNQLAQKEPVFASEYRSGKYYDCGNKLEWLKANIEFALRRDAVVNAARAAQTPPAAYSAGNAMQQRGPVFRHAIPPIRPDTEPKSDRFFERTIPHATAVLLREAGGPLHVNEIYNRLLEGGFQFTGQNPTISIAVSLNRNNRFRKVAPGTFDLVIRDAAQAS